MAKLPPYGAPLRSECELYEHRSREAKEQGQKYLQSISEKNTETDALKGVEGDSAPWLADVMTDLSDDLSGLKACDVIDDLDIDALGTFFDEEERELVNNPISDATAIIDSVSCALNDSVVEDISGEDDEEVCTSTARVASVGRFDDAAVAFREELQLLLAAGHPSADVPRCQELLQLLEMELSHSRLYRRRNVTQKKITSYFQAKVAKNK